MSAEKKLYSLEIVFDSTQVTLEELKEKAEDVLKKNLSDIHLQVNSTNPGFIKLAIKGELEVIDACHDTINVSLINQFQLKYIRILDEVSDYVRQQAYPILGEIEQRFRVFVSQALAEVHGFDWWDIAPSKISSKVQEVQNKHQEGILLNPLECTQFDDLIKIITAESSKWPEDKQISITDLLEVLSSGETIAEIKTNIEQKIKKISFWDVFSRYFEDLKKWEQIKKSINFVINERHKVMHHRPIRLGVIQALENKKREISTLLDSAKSELSDQERAEAQEDVKDIRETIIQIFGKLGLISNSQFSSMVQRVKESGLIPNSQFSSMFPGAIKSSLIPNSQFSSMFPGAIKSSLISNSQFSSMFPGAIKSGLIPNSELLDKFQINADSDDDEETVIESEINNSEGEK